MCLLHSGWQPFSINAFDMYPLTLVCFFFVLISVCFFYLSFSLSSIHYLSVSLCCLSFFFFEKFNEFIHVVLWCRPISSLSFDALLSLSLFFVKHRLLKKRVDKKIQVVTFIHLYIFELNLPQTQCLYQEQLVPGVIVGFKPPWYKFSTPPQVFCQHSELHGQVVHDTHLFTQWR